MIHTRLNKDKTLDYSELKLKFFQYLAEKSDENTDLTKLEETSIFSHSKEFKKFLSKEYGIKTSTLSLDLNDLLKALNSEEDEADDIEETEIPTEDKDISDEETDVEDSEDTEDSDKQYFDIDEDSENKFILEYINDFVNEDDVKKVIDADESGDLSDEEIEAFFKTIAENDKNAEDVSFDDIKSAYEQIQKGTFSLKTDDIEPDKAETTPVTTANPGGNTGTGSTQYTDPGNQNPTTPPAQDVDYSKKSLEELNALKPEKERAFNDCKDAMCAVYSGENEEVKKAQEDCKTQKEAYEKALQEDQQISSELKQQSLENAEAIENKENEIAQTQKSYIETCFNIYAVETEITNLTSNIEALKAQKVTLVTMKTDDDEQNRQIQENIANILERISTLEAQKAAKEAELQELNDTATNLNDTLTEQNKALAELQNAKKEIDDQINAQASEDTKKALDNYNKAKDNIETVKNNQVQIIQTSLTNAQTDLEKLNAAIRTKENSAIQKEYKVGQADLFTNAGYSVQKITRNGMDYVLIGPKDADPNQELPVMVYLHGSGEVGSDLSMLEDVGLLNMIEKNPSALGQTFNGYIIMPQTTSGNWKDDNKAQEIRTIVNEFAQTHAIDRDNIVIAGHSLGGTGALYMAGTNDDHFFSKALALSAKNPGDDVFANINIPVLGCSGTQEDNPTESLIKALGGDSVYFSVETGHAGVPQYAFGTLGDNGLSDIIEWLFSDYLK